MYTEAKPTSTIIRGPLRKVYLAKILKTENLVSSIKGTHYIRITLRLSNGTIIYDNIAYEHEYGRDKLHMYRTHSKGRKVGVTLRGITPPYYISEIVSPPKLEGLRSNIVLTLRAIANLVENPKYFA